MIRAFLNRLRSGTNPLTGVLAKLPVNVAVCAPVIQLVNSQLKSAVEKGNQSIDEVSCSFQGMAATARRVVAEATASLDTDASHASDMSQLDAVTNVLTDLLNHIEQHATMADDVAATLATVEERLTNVEECLRLVEAISGKAKLVALNGRIEAARAGTHGEGFAVVAAETKNLASNASDTSESIRDVVQSLGISLREASHTMQCAATGAAEMLQNSRERVHIALQGISSYQETLESNLRSASTAAEQLAHEISATVRGLQFQDAVSQRIGHAIDALAEVHDRLAQHMSAGDERKAKLAGNEWLERISATYTTLEERSIHDATAPNDDELSAAGSIELF